MEFRIVGKKDWSEFVKPFEKMESLSQCLAKSNPVVELASQACNRFYSENGSLERLSAPARLIFLVNSFDGEMLNGGIDQFFCNSSGNFAFETLAALKTLNAKISASILEDAIKLLSLDSQIGDQEVRYKTIQQKNLSDDFDKLDQKYHDNVHSFPHDPDEPENIWKLCITFMRAHIDDSIDA
jgi:hypothetical protein